MKKSPEKEQKSKVKRVTKAQLKLDQAAENAAKIAELNNEMRRITRKQCHK
jgi:hypothetical protein